MTAYVLGSVLVTFYSYGVFLIVRFLVTERPLLLAAAKSKEPPLTEQASFEFKSKEYSYALERLNEHMECYNKFMAGDMSVDPFNHEEPEDWWAEKQELEAACRRLNPDHRDVYIERVSDGHFKPFKPLVPEEAPMA